MFEKMFNNIILKIIIKIHYALLDTYLNVSEDLRSPLSC